MTRLHTRIASGKGANALRRTLLGGAAIAAFAAMPQAAFAQDEEVIEEEQGDGGLTDTNNDTVILVQARRQTETLQEVPVTVTVIGGETLQKFNVDNVADVTSRVPTLNVQVGGSGSGGQISLRGIGSSNISSAFDSAVAFDFDGVVVSSSRLVQAGFFDTAQIDVLKGPQSLFFGKSASAGVLSIRSANPTSTWEVGATANYEFEEEGYLINGYISGPITDTLGIRLAAQYNDVDEFTVQAPGTPAVNQERGLTDFIGRLTLDWEPLDRFRANLKLQYVRNENDGALGTSQIGCGANGRADEIVVLGVIAIPAGYDCNSFDDQFFQPDVAPPLAQSVPTPSEAEGFGGVPFGRTDLFFGRLRFDLDLSDTLTLTSVSGYVDLDATDVDSYSYGGIGPAFTFGIPIDATNPALGFLPPGAVPVGAIAPALGAVNAPGIPLGVGSSDPTNTLEQFSQELRLASNYDGPFNFMIGAFYESREFGFDTAEQAVNISLIAPDPITGFTFDYDRQLETKTEAASVFGSITFDLTDQLQLSGGLRYTDESKTQTISIPYVHSFLSAGGAFVSSGFFSGPIDFDDDNFSPEVTLRYQATDDINLFASYKTGFKSGGIDNSALPSFGLLGFASDDPAVQQATADSLIFESETTEGGEIGAKMQFADRTVTLNATAYYYVFDDLQVQNFNATTIQFVTSNAGEVTTQGIDLEFGWRTPIEGLNISGTLAWLDAEYTDSFVQPGPDGVDGTPDDIDLDGRRASQAPEFAGNFAVDWSIPVGDSFELNLAGNAAYNDGYFTDELTFDDLFQDSFWTLDANIGFGDADGKWRLSLIGVNLTDEIIAITSGGRPFLAPAGLNIPQGDDIVITQNRGRQVFVQAQVRF
ncbi:TonB-dependent receptor [Erythrobacter rubeus]|uniref:TonB-dependent receptor n=1 Tax=Erythrobacter rubeus TaxID=2760803 RepID=A0ABR8KRD9_9SPHN|nr:TonB-dependent receptor [Erythrobacter rubeus]MBD2843336.1 TonB-dependent receptor [Erythrobacter rubeus]